MDSPSQRIFGLDLLRALAIAMVIFSHATLLFPGHGTLFGAGLLSGVLGVELFFVLSGFLIGGILLKTFEKDSSPAALRQFWVRRWFRTLPNYFLFVAINAGLAFWLGAQIPSFWRFPLFLQNLASSPLGFFKESWSLAVEEWFYLLTPLLILAAFRRRQRPLREAVLIVLFGGILVVTLARVFYVVLTDPPWLTGVRMIVVYRLDACMFGVLGAWVKYYHPALWRQFRSGGLVLGTALLALVWAFPYVAAPDSVALRTTGFTLASAGALFLLPGLDAWSRARGPLSSAVTCLSLWSYSLYLVNLPVLLVLQRTLPATSRSVLAVLFVLVSVTLSAFLYRFFERPMTNLRERGAKRNATTTPPPVVAGTGS